MKKKHELKEQSSAISRLEETARRAVSLGLGFESVAHACVSSPMSRPAEQQPPPFSRSSVFACLLTGLFPG